MKVHLPRFANWLNLLALKVILFVKLEYCSMSRYISSATVIFVPKAVGNKSLSSVTVYIGPNAGCTVSHAVEFIRKSPTVKSNLRDFDILSITFNYSKL